jgi:hypothetical protein
VQHSATFRRRAVAVLTSTMWNGVTVPTATRRAAPFCPKLTLLSPDMMTFAQVSRMLSHRLPPVAMVHIGTMLIETNAHPDDASYIDIEKRVAYPDADKCNAFQYAIDCADELDTADDYLSGIRVIVFNNAYDRWKQRCQKPNVADVHSDVIWEIALRQIDMRKSWAEFYRWLYRNLGFDNTCVVCEDYIAGVVCFYNGGDHCDTCIKTILEAVRLDDNIG